MIEEFIQAGTTLPMAQAQATRHVAVQPLDEYVYKSVSKLDMILTFAADDGADTKATAS